MAWASAIAREFAGQGRALILCDRVAAPLEALAGSITGVPVMIVAGDITDAEYRAQIIAALGGRKIGALAHAAGVSPSMDNGPRVFADQLHRDQEHLVEALLPHMAPEGVAVLIASNSGQIIARPMVDRIVRKLIKGKSSFLGKIDVAEPSHGLSTLKTRSAALCAAYVGSFWQSRCAYRLALTGDH